MGRPWVDHPSWSIVAAASDASGRDVGRPAPRRRRRRAAPHRERPARHLRAQPGGPRRRPGARRALLSARPATASASTRALTAAGALRFEDGVRLVTERGASHAGRRRRPPGTMAAVLGLDDDVVAEACARATRRRVGGQHQRRRAGRDRRRPRRHRRGRHDRQGARRPQGAAPPGRRRLPHPLHGAGRGAPPARPSRRPASPTPRCPVHRQRRRPRPTSTPTSGPTCSTAQLTSPVRWRQTVERMVADGVHRLPRARPRRACSPAWPSARRPTRTRHASAAEPAALDERRRGGRRRRAVDHHEGEHLFAAERLVVSPAAGVFTPADDVAEGQHIERGPRGRARRPATRSARPSGARVKGLLAVAGERLTRSQPVAWLRTA